MDAVRAVLEVDVLEPGGTPADAGWVVLSPTGRDRPVVGGEARFEGLVPGTYAVVATTDEGQGEGIVDVAGAGASLAVRVVAPPEPVALAGIVSGPHGPLVDAVVAIDGVSVATTDATGAFGGGAITGGVHAIEVTPPPREAHLVPWTHSGVVFPDDGTLQVDLVLAGAPPVGTEAIGSGPCGACHGEIAARYADTAHALSGRAPAEVAGEPLTDAFTGPTVVPIDPRGAEVVLSATGPDTWWVEVRDAAGGSTGPLPVVHVYGGHRAGAAVAVEHDGVWRVAPAAWAAAGMGLSSAQPPDEWIPAWTDGWLDADGLLQPGPASAFDLQCAGCHAAGHGLTDPADSPVLAPDPPGSVLERTVGCEACHGAGDDHRRNLDPATILNPARLPAALRLEGCARCHERTSDETHPFDEAPGWPVTDDGGFPAPWEPVAEHAMPSPLWWLAAPSSRVLADQVGELRASPHRGGPLGWDGACSDCHDPHGSPHPADLHADDNTLCTDCHGSRFPDAGAEAEHAAHTRFEPGPWSPGGCTGCHLPRSGVVLRLDPVSEVGESHSHRIDAWHPDEAVAEFDALGVDVLGPGEVPVGPCLDCHLNVDAEARDQGTACPCPRGDPGARITYENLGGIVDDLWGSP